MKRIYQLVLIILLASKSFSQEAVTTVNAVLGDESFVQSFGVAPSAATGEVLRIQTHLNYVEQALRSAGIAHLSATQQQKRSVVLELLHQYWTSGIFPSNYDYPGERKPCFIDRNGNICAVGYLIGKTAGLSFAQNINAQFQYEYVLNMKNDKLLAWATEYGLTLKECAMIQPTYGYVPADRTNEVPVKTAYGISSGLLGGVNIGMTVANLSNRDVSNTNLVSRLGLISGTAQVALGLASIRKDQLDYTINSPSVRTSYKAQNNLSYINIAAGTTTLISSALNLYLQRNKKETRNAFNLYSYPAINNELTMGVSFVRHL